MLLPVELEKEIGANEFLKEGVEVIDTEEEASEIRIMQLHLRDNLALMPKLSWSWEGRGRNEDPKTSFPHNEALAIGRRNQLHPPIIVGP